MTEEKQKQPDAMELRQRRARIAERLLGFEEELSKVIDWTDLDNLPDWCALTDIELQKLVTLCGVAAYSRLMQNIIDGRVLRDYAALSGASIYPTADSVEFEGLPEPEADAVKHSIDSVGAAILLATVNNSPCLPALTCSMPCQPSTEFEPPKDQCIELLEAIADQASAGNSEKITEGDRTLASVSAEVAA